MAAFPQGELTEGETAAWLSGTLVVLSVQGAGIQTDYVTGVMALLEYFLELLVARDQKASLASVSS